jgi:hypothetical protein
VLHLLQREEDRHSPPRPGRLEVLGRVFPGVPLAQEEQVEPADSGQVARLRAVRQPAVAELGELPRHDLGGDGVGLAEPLGRQGVEVVPQVAPVGLQRVE